MDITVIGAAIIDILVGPVKNNIFAIGSCPVEYTKMSFGGDALNEAIILSKLGKKVQLISKVGNDEAGERVIDFVKGNGLMTEYIAVEDGLTTGMNIVLISEDGERSFLTNPKGSLRRLDKENILPYVNEFADIVSFASIFVSSMLTIENMEEVFKNIKNKDGRILTADMTKAKNGEKLEDIKPLLKYIDYIFPNEEEIALLTGIKDATRNAEILVEAGVKCAVIKCGRKGCIIKTKDEFYEIPAYLVEKPIDTTGAGDSFVAGFLSALSEGKSIEECGKFACRVAAQVVQSVGATSCSFDEM
ncbi:MAG: carbohydrate kinase family protein [Lachnospiraceae bacterium]|nr:carbohydrate kinase family protein [Lachnospiraceae bacterium]